MSRRDATNGQPSNYGREKQPMLNGRFAGPLPALLRRFVPVVFPGADVEAMVFALLGFTAFSTSWRENTTDGDLTQSFHEVGLYQCPAGPRGGPAPNRDPRAPNNAYGRLATGALVRRMLGRDASIEHNAWKPSNDTSQSAADVRAREDQVAVGLANLLADWQSYRSMAEAYAPGSTGAQGVWSVWQVFQMFTAFSRGSAGAFNRFKPFLRELATVPEAVRIPRLAALTVQAVISGEGDAIARREGNGGTAYGIVRTLQKLYSGLFLARSKGGPVAWFDGVELPREVELKIAETAYAMSLGTAAASAAETAARVAEILTDTTTLFTGSSTAGKVLAVALGLLAAGALGGGIYYATRA